MNQSFKTAQGGIKIFIESRILTSIKQDMALIEIST